MILTDAFLQLLEIRE